MDNPDYADGVNDMECALHSSFADLYDKLKKTQIFHDEQLSGIFAKIRDLTTHHSKMLRGDT